MAFTREQFGRVNATRVGVYEPETLLVVGPDSVKWRATGWNRTRLCGGGFHRITNAAGSPPYPLFPMVESDLDFVRFAECPEEEPDTPRVVTG